MMKTQSGQTNPKTIIGIDYSLTSPAICITTDFVFEKSKFYYLTSKKKYIGAMAKNITGFEHKEYDTPIRRFSQISDWVYELIEDTIHTQQLVYIEGYSFGSKGRGIFQIAENCGILKYRLQQMMIDYETVVPSVVKKGATGKGNADKDMMYESFSKETNTDLKKVFDTVKVTNPISDIVDSYYIAKIGYNNTTI